MCSTVCKQEYSTVLFVYLSTVRLFVYKSTVCFERKSSKKLREENGSKRSARIRVSGGLDLRSAAASRAGGRRWPSNRHWFAQLADRRCLGAGARGEPRDTRSERRRPRKSDTRQPVASSRTRTVHYNLYVRLVFRFSERTRNKYCTNSMHVYSTMKKTSKRHENSTVVVYTVLIRHYIILCINQ